MGLEKMGSERKRERERRFHHFLPLQKNQYPCSEEKKKHKRISVSEHKRSRVKEWAGIRQQKRSGIERLTMSQRYSEKRKRKEKFHR